MMGNYETEAKSEQMWRLRLFYTLDDMGIDPTSTIGLAVIDGYRPEIRCTGDLVKYDAAVEINRWIAERYMEAT